MLRFTFTPLVSMLCAATGIVQASESISLDYNLYAQGKYVYERNCLLCHGPRGDGTGELSVQLQPKPRSFREGMFKFRSTPAGSLPTEADLAKTIRGGLSGTGMGMFTQLADDDVRAVIEYVKSFSRRWRKAENYAPPMTLPEVPPWFQDTAERQRHGEAGSLVFKLNCMSCHGEKADGKGPAAAMLVDIWNQRAVPSDLRQPHLRCGDAPADVYQVLSTGLNGTPMMSFESVLSPEQRWDVVAYLGTLKLPEVPNLGAAPSSSLKLKQKP